jgi:hypothetical protein
LSGNKDGRQSLAELSHQPLKKRLESQLDSMPMRACMEAKEHSGQVWQNCWLDVPHVDCTAGSGSFSKRIGMRARVCLTSFGLVE